MKTKMILLAMCVAMLLCIPQVASAGTTVTMKPPSVGTLFLKDGTKVAMPALGSIDALIANLPDYLKAGFTDYDTYMMKQAMSGDLVLAISPATVLQAATNATWTRTVTITLTNAAGETHKWYNCTYSSGITSIGQATDGGMTASCSPAANLLFVNGVATVVITGAAGVWDAADTTTLTIANETILGNTVTGGTSVGTFY